MEKPFWKNRTVFITGCTGFVGSWLTIRLVDAGANVIGLVRDHLPVSNFFKSRLNERITLVTGSVTEGATVERALNEFSVDTCFHLAAQAIVPIANRSPLSTLESNIAGTWTLLEGIRNTRTVRRVVVASSDKAYGSYPDAALPYSEDYALRGLYPYDVSKACSDLIAQSYWHTYFNSPGDSAETQAKEPGESGDRAGPHLGITRCGNVIGGGDLNFGRIVPDTVRALLNDQPPVIRSHGQHVRDFLYVLDAVDAYLILAERLDQDGINGEAFNFSMESPVTMIELVEKLILLAGSSRCQAEVRGTTPAAGEILAQHLSCEKARRRLNWKPAYNLDESLRDTVDWYRYWTDRQNLPEHDLYDFNLQLLRHYEERKARG